MHCPHADSVVLNLLFRVVYSLRILTSAKRHMDKSGKFQRQISQARHCCETFALSTCIARHLFEVSFWWLSTALDDPIKKLQQNNSSGTQNPQNYYSKRQRRRKILAIYRTTCSYLTFLQFHSIYQNIPSTSSPCRRPAVKSEYLQTMVLIIGGNNAHTGVRHG